MKKRNTSWVKPLATTLVIAALASTTAATTPKTKAVPTASEWQHRPIEQVQADPKDKVDFARIQSECLQTAAIHFGTDSPWTSCRLGATGFVATIGIQDFYYAEYCLIAAGDTCDKQAQILFRNRAYRPEAFADMTRMDPAGTRYGSPVLIGTDKENVLTTTALVPGATVKQRRFFRYAQERWIPIDGKAWLQQLRTQLPKGVRVRVQPQDALPDPQTMMLSVPLYRAGDRTCCARGGSALVHLTIEEGQLQLADFRLVSGAP